MEFLQRPRPYPDESIESYFLRLTDANFYSNYQEFAKNIVFNGELSGHIKDWYKRAFDQLSSVNFYYEHQPEVTRREVFCVLANMLNLEVNRIEALGFHRSKERTKIGHRLIQFDDWLIPRPLFRQSGIPICIECLREENYIRKLWHLVPYKHCHKHRLPLVTNCPRCLQLLNYRESQNHHRCQCQFDLLSYDRSSVAKITLFDDVDQHLKKDNLLSSVSYEKKLRLLLWYFYRFDSSIDTDFQKLSLGELKQAEDYFTDWPSNFTAELKEREIYAEYFSDRNLSETPFRKVFGNIILHSCLYQVLGKEEPILVLLRIFVNELIQNHPVNKCANVADLLVSVEEIAILLNVENKKIGKAFEKGLLKPRFRLGANQPLEVYQPLFSLRQIVNLTVE